MACIIAPTATAVLGVAFAVQSCVLRARLEEAGMAPALLPSASCFESLVCANDNSGVTQTDNSTPYLARHVGERIGLDHTVPALTVNR